MRQPLVALSLLILSCGSAPAEVPDAGVRSGIVVGVVDAGPPLAPGVACTLENSATCETTSAALFCERGTWARYFCKGKDGCMSGSGFVRCDGSGAAAGEACPVLWEGSAVCRAPSGADAGLSVERLVCSGGRFQSTACPNACAESGGKIICG